MKKADEKKTGEKKSAEPAPSAPPPPEVLTKLLMIWQFRTWPPLRSWTPPPAVVLFSLMLSRMMQLLTTPAVSR